MNYNDYKEEKISNLGEQSIFQRLVKYFSEALMIPLSGIRGLWLHYKNLFNWPPYIQFYFHQTKTNKG